MRWTIDHRRIGRLGPPRQTQNLSCSELDPARRSSRHPSVDSSGLPDPTCGNQATGTPIAIRQATWSKIKGIWAFAAKNACECPTL